MARNHRTSLIPNRRTPTVPPVRSSGFGRMGVYEAVSVAFLTGVVAVLIPLFLIWCATPSMARPDLLARALAPTEHERQFRPCSSPGPVQVLLGAARFSARRRHRPRLCAESWGPGVRGTCAGRNRTAEEKRPKQKPRLKTSAGHSALWLLCLNHSALPHVFLVFDGTVLAHMALRGWRVVGATACGECT